MKTKTAICISVVLIAGVAGFYVYNRNKKKKAAAIAAQGKKVAAALGDKGTVDAATSLN